MSWTNQLEAISKNRELKKKRNFFPQRHVLSTSFDIFVVTFRVTNFLPKLVDMLLFSTEKTECPIGHPFWQWSSVQAFRQSILFYDSCQGGTSLCPKELGPTGNYNSHLIHVVSTKMKLLLHQSLLGGGQSS